MEQFTFHPNQKDPSIKTAGQAAIARFGHLNIIVDAITELQEIPPGSGIASVTGNIVDDTDPLNPIVTLNHGESLSGIGTIDDKLEVAIPYGSAFWTPDIDNPEVLIESGSYTQIGDIVTAAFSGRLILPALESTGDFTFSLPVAPANDFLKAYDVTGLINVHTNTSLITAQYVYALTGTATCFAKIRTDTTNANFSVYIQYHVAN